MIIDKNPVIDESKRTFKVQSDINPNEEVSIAINGTMAIHLDDIEKISGNTITVIFGLDIDWNNDTFIVFYE